MHKSVLKALMDIAPAHIVDPSTRTMLSDWQTQIHAMAHEHGVAALLSQRDAYVGALVGKVLTDLTKTVQIYVAVYGKTDEEEGAPAQGAEPADAAEPEADEDAHAQEPVSEGTPAETS